MDATKIAELVQCLAEHGIEIDAEGLQLGDPNDLIDRILEACRDKAGEEQEYEEPEPAPASGPVMMSLGGQQFLATPMQKSTKATVRDFERMVRPRGNGTLTSTPIKWNSASSW